MKRIAGKIVIGIVAFGMVLVLISKYTTNSAIPVDGRAGGDTLNVAIELSPMGIYPVGDTVAGLNLEILSAIAAQHSIPLKVTPVSDFGESTKKLKDGRFDLLIFDAAAISGLKEEFIFTKPVYIDRQVVVRKKNGAKDVFSVASLASDTVWVAANSPFIERLKNLSREIGDTIYIKEVEHIGSEALVMLVSAGEIRQAVVNSRLAEQMAADSVIDIEIAGEISFNQFLGWMTNKENQELRDSLDSYLISFKNTKEHEAILKKYL